MPHIQTATLVEIDKIVLIRRPVYSIFGHVSQNCEVFFSEDRFGLRNESENWELQLGEAAVKVEDV